MDATLSLGLPRLNQSGTLLEGIALWGELKPRLTQDDLIERALRYCDWRSPRACSRSARHVDVCDDRLLAVDALLEVRRRVSPISICNSSPFRRTATCAAPMRADNLRRALDKGVDVVGGIPHFERTMAEGAASVRALCEIAAAARPAWWTCTATRPTTRCRAMSRPWPSKLSASACTAASPAHTSRPCIRWTTTTSAKLIAA